MERFTLSQPPLLPTREADLQETVLAWLSMAGYYHKRIPIGAYPYRRGDGSVGWGKNPLKNFPDILVVLKNDKGRACVIELKSTKGKLSDGQAMELVTLEGAGVLCIVARDLMTVVETLRKEDVKR